MARHDQAEADISTSAELKRDEGTPKRRWRPGHKGNKQCREAVPDWFLQVIALESTR